MKSSWVKWLFIGGLAAIGAVFVAQNCFRPGGPERRQEADSLKTDQSDSLRALQQRYDSLDELSRHRDSIARIDSLEDASAEQAGRLSGQRLANLRQQLGMLTEVRDSNRVLVAITSEQET